MFSGRHGSNDGSPLFKKLNPVTKSEQTGSPASALPMWGVGYLQRYLLEFVGIARRQPEPDLLNFQRDVLLAGVEPEV
jgi:hypothetical protein